MALQKEPPVGINIDAEKVSSNLSEYVQILTKTNRLCNILLIINLLRYMGFSRYHIALH